MRSIADDLALAQSPVTDEDLMIHIINQLGDDFKTVVAAIKVQENPITYSELYDKLVDFERLLKETTIPPFDVVTANYTHTSRNGSTPLNRSMYPLTSNPRSHHGSRQGSRNSRPQWSKSPNSYTGNRNTRSNSHCQFCSIDGHDTKECRKLSRFLRENNIEINIGPVANTTTTRTNPVQPTWLFDTGASHHFTSDPSNLQPPMDYGGPDEIVLGNGMGLKITHTGDSSIPTSSRSLSLPHILCAPNLHRNLISVAKLWKTNKVYIEFFPSCFVVKDLLTGRLYFWEWTIMMCTMHRPHLFLKQARSQ